MRRTILKDYPLDAYKTAAHLKLPHLHELTVLAAQPPFLPIGSHLHAH